ncbi:hypothetical protein TRFO_09920 [Tritrichomonas foetus]|uniref:Intimal thickness related receptor IRP domain-containing protein n=1 Tax=Tritrichomonas foetus TaxID=1144522 RepID=A0A1J4JBG1_9EUKA|nr:hypothetical protein TRFO_09920 [Tritrichomonas foetus]|eukprot:OHS96530.1 hypothetical protein TRFO_09920 [Tritrichomonas foetus]
MSSFRILNCKNFAFLFVVLLLFSYISSIFFWIIRPPSEVLFDPSHWHLFFAYRESPSYYKIKIPSKSQFTRLPTFGFEETGKYSIKLTGKNISNINFLLINQDFSFSFKKFCSNTFTHNFRGLLDIDTNGIENINGLLTQEINETQEKISQSNISEEAVRFWNGTINEKGVYCPYLIDCSGTSSEFISISRFENPKIFDYREKGIYFLLKGLALLYPVITVLWILNSFAHPQFYVDIHHYLTFLPLFKAGVLILESELYNNKYVDPIDVAWSLTASVIVHSALVILLGIIASGWCTYEENIPISEIVIYAVLSLTLFTSSALSNYLALFTYLAAFSVFSMACLVIGTYWKIIKKLNLAKQFDQNLVKKLQMVLKFMNFCVGDILIFSLLNSLAMWLNLWSIVRIVIVEIGVLISFIIQMCFFFYRADHIPVKNAKIPITKYIKNKVAVLIEPNSKRLFCLHAPI